MFYIKVKDRIERANIIEYLKAKRYNGNVSLYPASYSACGKYAWHIQRKDIFTTEESSKLLRLPIYYGMKKDDIEFVVKKVIDFYK